MLQARRFYNYILAFPGMGKSYLARNNPYFIDADFGIYRESLNVPKDKEDSILESFAKYIGTSNYFGNVVMTNEPKLVAYIQFKRMYLPSPSRYELCAEQLGVDVTTIEKWVMGWAEVASKFRIPLTFLSVGLRDYLQSNNYSLRE